MGLCMSASSGRKTLDELGEYSKKDPFLLKEASCAGNPGPLFDLALMAWYGT